MKRAQKVKKHKRWLAKKQENKSKWSYENALKRYEAKLENSPIANI
jgi:hypothetical protein